jgi:hypothetical protein
MVPSGNAVISALALRRVEGAIFNPTLA